MSDRQADGRDYRREGPVSGLTIRPPVANDAAPLAELTVATWRSTYADLLPPASLDAVTVPNRQAVWAGLIERPGGLSHRVAEVTGKGLVGFISWGLPRGRQLRRFGHEVFSLYVLESFQRRGIGRRLLAEAFAAMTKDGGGSACVWVLDANRNAVAFYHGAGGEVVARGTGSVEGTLLTGTVYGWQDLATAQAALTMAAALAPHLRDPEPGDGQDHG